MTSTADDSLNIFGGDFVAESSAAAPVEETQETNPTSPSKTAKLFDPLSAASSPSKKPQELDLLGQISGWGAEHGKPEERSDGDAEKKEETTTPRKSLMEPKEGALELSAEFVQQAHEEFEKSATALDNADQ